MNHEETTHIDLFSGIGGFSLAADRVFGNVNHIFVEWDDFCQEVLKKHWPHAEYHKDIREFVANASDTGVKSNGRKEKNETFLLTGGFPCQPFSQAGRRQGTADDRYLWPPMLEAISIFRPKWVIAENVAGLASWNEGLVLETVCADLEREGYEVQPFVIPACAVGAPHKRDRIWFVAKNITNSERPRHTWKINKKRSSARRDSWVRHWKEDWLKVATRLCRMDDGIPRRLDRNPRLKALGNAIVPQVAEEIMRSMFLAELLK